MALARLKNGIYNNQMMQTQLTHYRDLVALRYQLYNGLFLTLPYHEMQEMGSLLALFAKYCATEITQQKSPQQMINDFYELLLLKGLSQMVVRSCINTLLNFLFYRMG